MMFNSNLGYLNLSGRAYGMGSPMWGDGRWMASSYSPAFFGFGVMFFIGVLFVVAAAFLIAAMVSEKNKRRAEILEPLKLRFVKGDLTEEEYLAKKAALLKK